VARAGRLKGDTNKRMVGSGDIRLFVFHSSRQGSS
jgi:hypothetical protein